MTTTISISNEVKELLENKKIHPRQSYDEVLKDLILSETNLKKK